MTTQNPADDECVHETKTVQNVKTLMTFAQLCWMSSSVMMGVSTDRQQVDHVFIKRASHSLCLCHDHSQGGASQGFFCVVILPKTRLDQSTWKMNKCKSRY